MFVFVCMSLYTFLQRRFQLRNFVILHLRNSQPYIVVARHTVVYGKLATKLKRKRKNEFRF